ncbi:Bactoprenol glucosyl transferase homolog from prophage CPS-53 [Weeksella virosa]|uniref:glycosyltransferase family 2 protein n=1 Tax=Weeksella virosa TaxID=1014 RepID=UPI000E000BA6|nr:glycosyltransferase family 2 protein [Weeksella virosa]SUP54109.1 Bactoprenol glucosyl transferase homolog from prophage CPS-53 [Weeksella virosa]
MKKISLITPVFNEEQALPIYREALNLFKKSLEKYIIEWVIIDDGSTDATPTIISDYADNSDDITSLIFSRNFGKEAALFAGLEASTGDIVIPMDIDLQDPFDVIFDMIKCYENGADVVLAKRTNRDSDSKFKRMSALWFYRLNNKMSSLRLEENVGDFRLMSRQVVDEIIRLQENQLFMKGLMSWVGFQTAIVTYERPIRSGGQTKFNFFKLWNLAIEGITSFSTIPLKVWLYFGGITSLTSFLFGLKIIFEKIFLGISVSGYASIMVTILFFGGVQLIGIGVLGEYIGRTYLETKRRPKYIIRKKIN